ncbi:MAG: SRPBCC family protein [Thermoleophilia bacterium]|nr:SRPBCC family protein [Thermoleophilia bacterium]
MKLRNEFVVAAPLEQTWRTLLDVPRVASALPGATIEPGGDAGAYRGRLSLKIGPVTAQYEGTARIEEVDEDAHVASFYVQGAGGQGSAAATITNRLEQTDGGTRVVVETDLRITGRAASFGRGLMEEVAARMVKEFADRLQAEITAPRTKIPLAGPEAKPLAFDLGAAAWEPLVRRYALPALVALVLLLLLRRPKVIVIREP